MELWGFWPGIAAFVVALLSGVLQEPLSRVPARLARAAAGIGLALSVYSVVNGVHGLGTWQFVDLLGEALNRGTKTSPSGWFALLLIEFWPFAAIGMGAVGAYLYWIRFRFPEFQPPETTTSHASQPPNAASMTNENERKAIERMRIVSAYGQFLEENAMSPDKIADVKMLPFPKDAILDAICLALVREQDENRRNALEVGALFLPYFQEGVGDVPLSMFGFELPSADTLSDEDTLDLAKKMAAGNPDRERYETLSARADQEREEIRLKLEATAEVRKSMPEDKKREILG